MIKRSMLHFVTYLLLLGCLASGATAQMVEVAPGIRVTKKTYNAALNEQPFYGFMDKDRKIQEIDKKLVDEVIAKVGSKEKGAETAIRSGWTALASGDYAVAGRRFNQAYLIDPKQSAVYHSFAVLADARFNDPAYAEELFKVAKELLNPLPHFNGDYGRFLLMQRRPREALPLLEKAAVDQPKDSVFWSNLGFARLQNGDQKGACVAAVEAKRHLPPPNIESSDLAILRTQAKCN